MNVCPWHGDAARNRKNPAQRVIFLAIVFMQRSTTMIKGKA